MTDSNFANQNSFALGISNHKRRRRGGLSLREGNVMDEKTENVSSLVVLERDAGFPKWIAEYQRAVTNSLVVAHAPGESGLSLSRRALRRIGESSSELRSAIIACSSSLDGAELSARESLCRELLLALGEQGELVLALNADASEDSKHAIFELAGALCETLGGTSRVQPVTLP